MALIELNINDKALEALENYAERHDISTSEFIRRAVLARLEDLEDIEAANQAYAEYLKNPVTIPWEEAAAKWA